MGVKVGQLSTLLENRGYWTRSAKVDAKRVRTVTDTATLSQQRAALHAKEKVLETCRYPSYALKVSTPLQEQITHGRRANYLVNLDWLAMEARPR